MEVKDFFAPEEWKGLIDYEKTRILNLYDKYLKMKELGFDPPQPDFLLNYKKRKRDDACSSDCDNEPPLKKSLMDDETELRLSQELEGIQVSQGDDEAVVSNKEIGKKVDFDRVAQDTIISSKDESHKSQESDTTLEEIPLELNIHDDGKRLTRSMWKNLNEKTASIEKIYSTRNSAKNKYYHEYSSPEEDDYECKVCDECQSEYLDGCPVHGLLKHIPDAATSNVNNSSNEEYALRTIPPGLKVGPSAIKNAGLGVWTTKPIPGGSRFGPYKGTIVSNPGKGDYAWEIRKYRQKRQAKPTFVDGSDPSKSNWMRYVNSARNFTEQNLVAYQYEKKIYYRVPYDIPANRELYVFYGSKYTRELGINTRRFFEPPKIPLEMETFECDICEKSFSSPIERDSHRTSVCQLELQPKKSL